MLALNSIQASEYQFKITDISTLVNNSRIGEEDKIYLTGNPLNEDALTVHIPALTARGAWLMH